MTQLHFNEIEVIGDLLIQMVIPQLVASIECAGVELAHRTVNNPDVFDIDTARGAILYRLACYLVLQERVKETPLLYLYQLRDPQYARAFFGIPGESPMQSPFSIIMNSNDHGKEDDVCLQD